METIKTQLIDGERRIITKIINEERKVSCSCCELGCCMYSANQFGTLFGAGDLPDILKVNWTNRFTNIINKTGSGYESGPITLTIVNNRWTLKDTSTTPETVRSVGQCLIRGDGNLTEGDNLVEDQFTDTYEVSYQESINSQAVNVIVTRIALCVWQSEIFNIDQDTTRQITMEYFDGTKFPQHKWIIQNSFLLWVKQPFQNSPVGIYSNTNLPSITVS
jgi:hypothetical protein